MIKIAENQPLYFSSKINFAFFAIFGFQNIAEFIKSIWVYFPIDKFEF